MNAEDIDMSWMGKRIGVSVMLLSLFCFHAPSEAARLLENCQAIGYDIRNAENSFSVAYQNKELWEIKCTTASGVPETVRLCVDDSSQYGSTTTTTPAPVYSRWQKILHDSLENTAKRFAIWFEHQPQYIPAGHHCKAGGYWVLIRMCTIANCFLGGHF